MKSLYTLIVLFSLTVMSSSSFAQERYLDEVFTDVTVTENVIYSANATVLLVPVFGQAIQIPILMDVYEPTGDTEAERPLVLVFHTGNFLPNVTNGQISGTKQDSSVVEFCTRFAKMGYVAAAVDYRTGWNPLAATQPERALGLIQAAYRGMQDARTAVRFFRNDAQTTNAFGIDPNSVTAFGLGTGGYLTLVMGCLDDYFKIVQTESPAGKFLLDLDGDMVPETPMVVPVYHGDINGETTSVTPDGAFGLPAGDTTTYAHYPGISSDINLVVNVGGALGDIGWLDAMSTPVVSVQSPFDIFAPYDDATVIVPTTGDPVVRAQGSLAVARRIDSLGNNSALYNATFSDSSTDLAIANSATAGHEYYPGLFPFIKPSNSLGIDEGVVLNWWDPDSPSPADGQGMGVPWNQLPHPSGGTFHEQGLVLNEGMSAEKSRANIDDIMTFVAPRACVILELPCAANFISSTEELLTEQVEVKVSPNPTSSLIQVDAIDETIERIEIVSIDGRLVQVRNNINDRFASMNISSFESGNYVLKIYFEDGLVTKQIIKE
ncbi:MAG: T9SS type A sorting domain-containing protein [Bacteroidia bacterium]|nr:T9SS type A sorting domain-containing protein [Bacteroidia bacterium]